MEMKEEGKSPKRQRRGFPFFLGKRKESVSHIPNAATTAVITNTKKGTFLKSYDIQMDIPLTAPRVTIGRVIQMESN